MHERAHAELARLREASPHRFGWAVYQHLFEVARQTRRAADAISMQGMSETERHYANVDFARRMDADMRDVAVVRQCRCDTDEPISFVPQPEAGRVMVGGPQVIEPVRHRR